MRTLGLLLVMAFSQSSLAASHREVFACRKIQAMEVGPLGSGFGEYGLYEGFSIRVENGKPELILDKYEYYESGKFEYALKLGATPAYEFGNQFQYGYSVDTEYLDLVLFTHSLVSENGDKFQLYAEHLFLFDADWYGWATASAIFECAKE